MRKKSKIIFDQSDTGRIDSKKTYVKDDKEEEEDIKRGLGFTLKISLGEDVAFSGQALSFDLDKSIFEKGKGRIFSNLKNFFYLI